MSIIDKIHLHKRVYEMAAEEVPPFRITCAEHKELAEFCKRYILTTTCADNNFKSEITAPTSMIICYYGVDIEVVMKVEAYL